MENPSERENRLGNLTKSLKSLSRTLEIEEIYLFQYQMLPPPFILAHYQQPCSLSSFTNL